MIEKERLGEISKAKHAIVEGSITIWNTRLELLVAAGDLRGALDQLLAPIEDRDINNCGCNVQCGAASRGELAGQPGRPALAGGPG